MPFNLRSSEGPSAASRGVALWPEGLRSAVCQAVHLATTAAGPARRPPNGAARQPSPHAHPLLKWLRAQTPGGSPSSPCSRGGFLPHPRRSSAARHQPRPRTPTTAPALPAPPRPSPTSSGRRLASRASRVQEPRPLDCSVLRWPWENIATGGSVMATGKLKTKSDGTECRNRFGTPCPVVWLLLLAGGRCYSQATS